jgi:hypothetical protein
MNIIKDNSYEADDEIDLRQLLQTLWLQRTILVVLALASAALGLGVSELSTKYVSEAVLQLPQKKELLDPKKEPADALQVPIISAANYKRYESVLLTGANLAKFLQRNPQASPDALALLEPLTLNAAGLREAIRPEFSFTDKDQKALGVKSAAIDPGAMVGWRLSIDSANPTQGTPLFLLADYVRDTILRVDMETAIYDGCLQSQTQAQALRVEQLKDEFKFSQEERRAKTLRGLVSRSPGSQDTRQVVTVDKGSERFLSPAAQLNASEITMSELRLAQVNRERDRIASALKQAYYCDAANTLQKPLGAAALIDALKLQQAAVFKDKTKDGDIIDQTANEFELQRDNWGNNYLRGMRFVSSPEGSEVKTRKPGRALGLILGALLGGLLGVVFVFGRQWWLANKGQITAP